MEKTIEEFLAMTDEQLRSEIPLLLQLVDEKKVENIQMVAELLLKFPTEITPFIFELFESESTSITMKEWSLDYIVPQLPFFVKIALEDALQKIVHSPTDDEKLAELDQKAMDVLNGFV
ncbi:DUF5071 domain-containing protein [Ureibacillus aquaedulcis]|uniref:DUF5071 domain-containing protein n=1 Tax=Ureibacillus aquaedulcis TaxID=3058421 RepID=A0ABT8GPF0_9BACL|nr:DUF5071 domain-containing protein [Ureibacillus sp. BA0131]MDN4493296.1 DUF5071 domain-containing protein [Ureibacillus sp. BA0131]